jgi:Protein of unknown function (DUF1194)
LIRPLALATAILALLATPVPAQTPADRADTALVLAVDVSGSVDASRFALQMEGIASAFEDSEVQRAIFSGPRGTLLVILVNWSHKPEVAIPWTIIASRDDALNFAAKVRAAPRRADDFTCMATMMELVADKVLPLAPLQPDRMVVDVSGDGRDNCNPRTAVDSLRDSLVSAEVTINGLPILEGKEAATIEGWYKDHVIGGPASFLLPANGYQDFGRAIRRKFILEISGTQPALAQN